MVSCRHLVVVFTCAALGACATGLETVQRGGEIAIVPVKGPGADPPIVVSGGQIVGEDAGAGSVGGTVVGALAGLTCGPLAVICVPGFASLGGFAGAGAGALVGGAEIMTSETFHQLEASVRPYAERHRPRDSLIAALKTRAASRFTLATDTSPSATVLAVRMSEATVYFLRDNRAMLALRASVISKAPGQEARRIAPMEQWFTYVGPVTPAWSWIDDENDFIAQSFDHAYEQLAESILAEQPE
jgi:hypothetical protein